MVAAVAQSSGALVRGLRWRDGLRVLGLGRSSSVGADSGDPGRGVIMMRRVARDLRARAGQKAEEDEASDRHRDSALGST